MPPSRVGWRLPNAVVNKASTARRTSTAIARTLMSGHTEACVMKGSTAAKEVKAKIAISASRRGGFVASEDAETPRGDLDSMRRG